MSSISTPVQIRHRTNADLFYKSQLLVYSMSSAQRLQAATKIFLICLVAAIIFLFIPVLHFILVPGALLVGIFLFFRSLKITNFLQTAKIQCPQCQKDVVLSSKPFNWPINTNCPSCRSEIVVEKLLS